MNTSSNSITTVLGILLLSLIVMGADGCSNTNSNAANKASEDVEKMANQLYSEVGTPEITNFQEYKFAKMIMELRDQKVTTYTYMVDRDGERHPVCESVGFGLPYSTQLTNPEKPINRDNYVEQNIHAGSEGGEIPQREPNGLYMPDNVSATWILCKKKNGGFSPVYSEPQLLVYPEKPSSFKKP